MGANKHKKEGCKTYLRLKKAPNCPVRTDLVNQGFDLRVLGINRHSNRGAQNKQRRYQHHQPDVLNHVDPENTDRGVWHWADQEEEGEAQPGEKRDLADGGDRLSSFSL